MEKRSLFGKGALGRAGFLHENLTESLHFELEIILEEQDRKIHYTLDHEDVACNVDYDPARA